MKIFKKIIVVILTIININLLTATVLSYNFKEVFVNGIIKATMKSSITSTLFKAPNVNINKNATSTRDLVTTDDAQINKIIESDEVQNLATDYVDKTLSSIDDPDEINNIDFEGDAINYIKDNKDEIEKSTGITITDDMLDKVAEKMKENNVNGLVRNKVKEASNNITPEQRKLIRWYNKFVSQKTRNIFITIIIVSLILILLLQKSFTKWIKNIGITSLISGIEIVAVAFISSYVIENVLSAVSFNTKPLLKYGGIFSISGLIILIIGCILGAITKKKTVK